jgi:hypothetical protein
MAHPEYLIDKNRKQTQTAPLAFPKDGSINSHQTMISLQSYQRGNPRSPPTKINPRNIFLPLPMSGIEDNISLQYQDVPLGAVGGILSPAKSAAGYAAGAAVAAGQFVAGTALGAAGDVLSEYATSAAQKAGSGAAAVTQRVLQSGQKMAEQAKEAGAQSIGLAENPNMSLSFQGVELRTHTFTWRLIAKSREESLEIENIINTLKLNALPKKLFGAGFHLSYPSIAMINFFPANLIKISDLGCFITGVSVKYDGDGHPVFFQNQKPVIVDLTVSFKERAILTADDYEATNSIGLV